MGDFKLSSRPEITNSNSQDLIHISRHGTSYKSKISALGIPAATTILQGNQVIFGGVSYKGVALGYRAWATSYIINQVNYTVNLAADIDLDTGGANDRWDLFIVRLVNGVPEIAVVKGVEDGNVIKPTLDPLTEVEIGARIVAASETVDGTTILDLMYKENAGDPTEWNATTTIAGSNYDDTTNPYIGTKSINVPAVSSLGDFFEFTTPTPIALTSNGFFVFALRGNGETPTIDPSITISLIDSASGELTTYQLLTSNASEQGGVEASSGNSLTPTIANTDWQVFQIKISDFGVNGNLTQIDKIKMSLRGTPSYNIDNINFQSGINQPIVNATGIPFKVVLSPDRVKNWGTNKVQVIPSAGPGRVQVIDAAVIQLDYQTEAYAAQTFNLEYGAGSGVFIFEPATNLISQASYQLIKMIDPLLAAATLVPNEGIYAVGIDSATGDSPVTIQGTYSIFEI